MSNIIPKSSTWITIIACFVIIIIVAVLYGNNFYLNFEHRLGFKIGVVAGVAAMLAAAVYWAISLSDAAYEYFSNRMWLLVVAFAFTFIWICGWSSQYKADASDKIQYNGK